VPIGIETETHQRLTKKVGHQHKKQPKLKQIQMKADPLKEQQDKMTKVQLEDEAKKAAERAKQKGEKKHARKRSSSGLSSSWLEPGIMTLYIPSILHCSLDGMI
jgi:hypothetical protein